MQVKREARAPLVRFKKQGSARIPISPRAAHGTGCGSLCSYLPAPSPFYKNRKENSAAAKRVPDYKRGSHGTGRRAGESLPSSFSRRLDRSPRGHRADARFSRLFASFQLRYGIRPPHRRLASAEFSLLMTIGVASKQYKPFSQNFNPGSLISILLFFRAGARHMS